MLAQRKGAKSAAADKRPRLTEVPATLAEKATLAPRTPDGRYMVVRGRLWRLSDPHLDPARRTALVSALMTARRQVRDAADPEALKAARAAVDAAKRALGERGPVWWADGAPDYNRRLARNTPYAAWFAALSEPPAEPPAGPEEDADAMRAGKKDSIA
jgi:hypothetical protein